MFIFIVFSSHFSVKIPGPFSYLIFYLVVFGCFLISLFYRWVGRLRTVGIQRGGGQEVEDLSNLPPDDHSRRSSEGDLDFATMQRHQLSPRYDDNDGMPSPYSGTSSYSSYAGGSSIPSTPGSGSFTPGYPYSPGVYGSGFASGAPSPRAMGLGALSSMSLNGSTYSTPRSVTAGLPEDEEDDRAYGPQSAGKRVDADMEGVRIVGMDVEVEEDGKRKEDVERGVGKMDVDV